MTKGVILFGLAVGGTIGLFIPRLFGNDGIGIANIVTAVMGAVVGLIVIGAVTHYYGRLQ